MKGSYSMLYYRCIAALLFFPAVVHTFASSSSTSASKSYDLVVIGGGSAGLTAAKFASTFGKSAVIIEKDRMGGDCTWTGCVPSKSILASAKAAQAVKKASDFGIEVGSVKVDLKAVKRRIDNNIRHIYDEDDSPEALKKLGVDVIQGVAKFDDAKKLKVFASSSSEEDFIEVSANDGILIATGAKPRLPTISGIQDVNFITYEQAFSLDTCPSKMTVIGCGPIACELAQAYSRLGADVTVIAPICLPGEEPETNDIVQSVFVAEGINYVKGYVTEVEKNGEGHSVSCSGGETIKGDLLLVATGRVPTVNGMDIEKIGVELDDGGGIKVDSTLQTSVKGLYAAGDCTGDRQFTHYAGYQGAVGARNILLPLTDPGVITNVPSTTFFDPEIASVGLTEKEAIEEFGEKKIAVAFKRIDETDRGICEGSKYGFIKIIYKKRGYKILGATIASPVAGELIAEISVAMKTDLSFDMLATVMHTYPSHSFALQAMAAEVYYDKLVKSKPILNFLKWLGL